MNKNNWKIEIIEDNNCYSALCTSTWGKQYSTLNTYQKKEQARSAACSLIVELENKQKQLQKLEGIAKVTLLLVYLYLVDKIGREQLELDPVNPYWIYGPLGEYAVLDALKEAGYLENVSERNSRWAKIILTRKGAVEAKHLQTELANLSAQPILLSVTGEPVQ